MFEVLRKNRREENSWNFRRISRTLSGLIAQFLIKLGAELVIW
jgi:hypothetical protein